MPQYPAFSYLVLFLLGFAFSPLLALGFEESFWFSLLIILIGSLLFYSEYIRLFSQRLFLFICFVLLGLTSYKFADAQYQNTRFLSSLLAKSNYSYEIVLTNQRQEYPELLVYDAKIRSINGIAFRRKSVRFYSPERYSVGTCFHYHGRLRKPRQAHNYFEFNEESFFYRRNILGKIYADQAVFFRRTGQSEKFQYLLGQYRGILLNRLADLPSPLGEYCRALIFGDRYAFSFEERDTFFRMGIIHLFAISGLHVGIFYLLIKRLAGLIQLSLFYQWGLCLLVLVLYIGILGVPLSALRVLVMLVLYIAGKLLRKIVPFFQVVSLTAFLFIIIEGVQVLWNLSFVFSFLATFGIVFSREIIRQLYADCPKKYNQIINLFFISVVINILTLPITFSQFNFFPWFQSLINLAVVPLFPFFVIYLWIVTLSAFIVSPDMVIFQWLNAPLGAGHSALNTISGHSFFYRYYYPYEAPVLFFICSYLFLLFWYLMSSGEITFQQAKRFCRARNTFGLMTVISLLLFLFSAPSFEVKVPYIGQGQAVIISGYGKTIVYDCGPPRRGYQPLVDILQKRYQGQVDLLILSHYHLDHVGNLEAFLKKIKPEQAWITPYTENPDLQQEIRDMFARRNIPLLEPTAPLYHQFNPLFAVQVLYPLQNMKMPGENDNSLVVAVDAGRWRMLINGDISSRIERFLTEIYPISSDILFAAHHGSGTSSSLPFLLENSPKGFIIQCGIDNRYGHPHPEVLQRARQLSLNTLRTDKHGQINIFQKRKNLYSATYHQYP